MHMTSQAKSKFFVAYDNDQVALQALKILHRLGFQAHQLDEGVPPPKDAVFIFSSDGRFASKFIATKPEQYEKRGIMPPATAAKALQLLPIRKAERGLPYGAPREENLARALEIFVGYERERTPKPKRNRREESKRRRRENLEYACR